MRSRASRLLLTFSLVLLAAAPAFALGTRGPALSKLMTDDTVFYVEADPGQLAHGLQSLDFAALLREPEVQSFLAPLWSGIDEIDGADPVGSLLAHVPIQQFLAGPMAFGISGIGIEVKDAAGRPQQLRISPSSPLTARTFHRLSGIVGDDLEEEPDVRLALDFLATVTPGPALRRTVLDFLANPPRGFELGEVMMADLPVQALNIQPDDGPRTTIYADMSGDQWLIGGDQKSFEAALTGMTRDTLHHSKTFRNFSSRVSGQGNVLFAYLDCARFLQTFRNLVPPIALEEAQILGFDDLQGVAFGMSMLEGGVRESILLGFDGEPHGIFSIFDAFGGGFPALASPQPTTAGFVGVRFDIQKLHQSINALIGDLAPGFAPRAAAEMARLEVHGHSVMQDILPALGSELTIAASRPRIGLIPDFVFSMEVRDPKKFSSLLATLKQMAESEGDVGILPLTLKDGDPGFALRIPEAPIQPAFALRGDRLYGAVSALTLKNYLYRHLANPDRETLAATSDVMPRVLHGLTAGREDLLTLLLYLDLKNTLPVLYDSGAPFMAAAFEEEGIPLEVAMLPMSETLTPHLTGIAVGLSTGPEGISIDCFSPTGLMILGAMAGIAEEMHGGNQYRHEQSERRSTRVIDFE